MDILVLDLGVDYLLWDSRTKIYVRSGYWIRLSLVVLPGAGTRIVVPKAARHTPTTSTPLLPAPRPAYSSTHPSRPWKVLYGF